MKEAKPPSQILMTNHVCFHEVKVRVKDMSLLKKKTERVKDMRAEMSPTPMPT